MTSHAPSGPATTPRQEELLDQTLQLVREVGLAGLTVRKLAERVGFTEAALYRHYPNKQALLLALVERLSEERLLAPIRAIAADATLTPRERLTAIVRHHVATVLAVDGIPVLILAEAAASGDEVLLARFRKVAGELRATLERLLAAAGPPAGVSPAAVGLALFGVVAATALNQRLLPDAALAREARDVLPAYLVDCLLPTEAAS